MMSAEDYKFALNLDSDRERKALLDLEFGRRQLFKAGGSGAGLLVFNRLLGSAPSRGTTLGAVAAEPVPPNPVWPRPVIHPIPDITSGVADPVMSLDGKWKFSAVPPANFWSNTVDPAAWSEITVPGQPQMQSFQIQQNVEMAYKTLIHIPADYVGKAVILQFDGVYSYARVWVNGQFVRDHTGGFTTWDVDITKFVSPGQDAWVTVGVTDKSDDISFADSYASGFASGSPTLAQSDPVLLGGILQDVRLMALPIDPLTRFDISTQLDATYTNATMRVYLRASMPQAGTVTVTLRLLSPQGAPVPLSTSTVDLTAAEPEVYADVPVPSPHLWDPEHPWLYTLQATEYVNGRAAERVSRQIGFRAIEVAGNRMLVNGHEVKLRGVTHLEISPTGGRSEAPGLDAEDIKLLRAANVNAIRTTPFPPPPALLAAADKYGIFVDEETAVTWPAYLAPATQDDPNYKAEYLNQFAEMIARDRSHPSVLMWSLGNESGWGSNYAAEYDYAKAEDPGRPMIFSDGAGTADIPPIQTDVISVHYPPFTGPFGGQSMPVYYDEYAPLNAATVNPDEQRRDPNVENVWGRSIKALWEKIFTSPGALGGNIWSAVDDNFLLSTGPGGYGDWGLLDVWRRPRPQYWLTKMAYSPVRVSNAPLPWPSDGKTVSVPVGNWFDFTNLNELTIDWTAGRESGTLSGPDVPPRENGVISFPISQLTPQDSVSLKFYRPGQPTVGRADLLVAEYRLQFSTGAASAGVDPAVSGGTSPPPQLSEDDSHITVTGKNFQVSFSKQNDLIDNATLNGATLIQSGPYLNLVGDLGIVGASALAPWTPGSMNALQQGSTVAVNINGRYGSVGVKFTVSIDGDALLKTSYTIENPPAGSYSEVGVAYIVPDAVDRLTWQRQALWSVYPSDHIGRPSGTALKERPGPGDQYGVRPAWPWSLDMKQFALFGKDDLGGRGTTDFRSTKQNILYASAVLGDSNLRLRAESDGSDSVRLETPLARLERANAATGPCSVQRCVDDYNPLDPAVTYNGTWYHQYNTFSLRGYNSTWSISQTSGDSATFTFTGASIKWIGDTQYNMGMADVYLDGQLAAHDVDLYSPVDLSAGSPPQGAHYQQVLFSKSELPPGQHTIKIVVTGDRNPQSQGTFVNIDAFAVDGAPVAPGNLPQEGIAFLYNNYESYPEMGFGDLPSPGLTIPSGYTNSVSQRLTDRDGIPAALAQKALARQPASSTAPMETAKRPPATF